MTCVDRAREDRSEVQNRGVVVVLLVRGPVSAPLGVCNLDKQDRDSPREVEINN